jgi:hypothetical protein
MPFFKTLFLFFEFEEVIFLSLLFRGDLSLDDEHKILLLHG